MRTIIRKVKRGKRSIKQRKAEEIQSIVNLKNFPQVQKSLTKKVLVPKNPQMKMNLLLRKMMTCSSQTTNFLANLMYLKPKLRSLNMREQLLKEGNANEGDLQKMKKWMWTRSQKKKRKTGLANCVEKQTILNGFCYATAVMTAITHLAFVQACAYFSTLKGNFQMIFFH